MLVSVGDGEQIVAELGPTERRNDVSRECLEMFWLMCFNMQAADSASTEIGSGGTPKKSLKSGP